MHSKAISSRYMPDIACEWMARRMFSGTRVTGYV